MPAKDLKKKPSNKSSICTEALEDYKEPHEVSLHITLKDNNTDSCAWIFLIIFNGQLILESKWQDGLTFEIETLSLNLKNPYHQFLIADRPLMFLLRTVGGKASKETDLLLHSDNRAGGAVDLFPLLLGETEIFLEIPLLNITTGLDTHCSVVVRGKSTGDVETTIDTVPLTLTLISAHCLPIAREGTVYISAIGLNGTHDPAALNFGMSLSNDTATKVLWASVSNAGLAANTAYNVPKDDKFIPEDLIMKTNTECISVYWNAIKRVLVNPLYFQNRLQSPFVIEIAGVPRTGKIDIRGRYMAFIDAGVLLEPGQYGVTVCAKLQFYNELELPENVCPLLELPTFSAKSTARDTENVMLDMFGHSPYIIIRFDLFEPMVLQAKITSLYKIIGCCTPEGTFAAVNQLQINPPKEDLIIDVRRIRKECGALAIHKELSEFDTASNVPVNKSVKRVATSRLLIRIRSMLKQFTLGEYPLIDWQDNVTSQHAACRRAVISSFSPQPPIPRMSSRVAVSRSRVADNLLITKELMQNNLKAAPSHPRILLCKVLRCLEERNETEAQSYLVNALGSQPQNRFLLWTFGGIFFDKNGCHSKTRAAFCIAVKGNNMDGITGAIGWAALHTLNHFYQDKYAAFVAATRMRKCHELSRDWRKFLQEWVETSGEEETFWIPGTINPNNALLVASAFFLCLRCYKFSEKILECVEAGCANRGSKVVEEYEISKDIHYLKASSMILRGQIDDALNLIVQGIKKFGPSAMMSQMYATCLAYLKRWDEECETALEKADRAGAELNPTLLLQAANGSLKKNLEVSLQYAARAHKIAPSAHSALMIARVYAKMGNEEEAERWAATAVNVEPLFANGWAFLGIMALSDKNIDKSRSMLRTAKQVANISSDIQEELKTIMRAVKISALPDDLVKDICFCEYY